MYDAIVYYWDDIKDVNNNIRIQFSSWNNFENEVIKHNIRPRNIRGVNMFITLDLGNPKLEQVYPDNSSKD